MACAHWTATMPRLQSKPQQGGAVLGQPGTALSPSIAACAPSRALATAPYTHTWLPMHRWGAGRAGLLSCNQLTAGGASIFHLESMLIPLTQALCASWVWA